MVVSVRCLLEQSHKLFGRLCNIEGALYDLLRDKVLVERLPLAPQYQQATLGLEVRGCRRERRQVGGDGRVSGLLGEKIS